MPHQITPQGRWKKEVSWNDPDVMYSPDGGHINNQITPEEYVMEREIESGGETVLNLNTKDPTKLGKIDSKKLVDKLKNIMSDNYYNADYEYKLKTLASERPSIGGFFDMGASMQLDDMIKAAKENGQIDNNNNFHAGSQIHVNAPMNSMMANLNRLKGIQQPQSRPQPQQQQQQMMRQSAQLIPTPEQRLEKIDPRPKIKASREQLKNLIAQKQQSSNLVKNPYAGGKKTVRKGR